MHIPWIFSGFFPGNFNGKFHGISVFLGNYGTMIGQVEN
jgi:hypothetical protein